MTTLSAKALALSLTLLATCGLASAQTAAGAKAIQPVVPGNDYPTTATADYVFGCMQANGNTPQALERCSCSFDVVASIVPYERYLEASTYLSMGQVTGEKGVIFRTGVESKASIGDLRRAQAEAEIRCFE